MTSALIATLGVASLRNSRRAGHSLTEQADHASAAVSGHTPAKGAFLTAVLGRLDLQTGTCALVNAGHVPPILIRDGEPGELTLPRNFALGMFPGTRARAGSVTLQPGDRLVIVTDGMREREAAALDLTAELRSLTALHPREAARSLAVAGPALQDDATLLIIDWHGRHDLSRRASAGADVSAATSADRR
ncbi:PP2C family protein-serine/threonine phosphatase [Nucisporomicrobium flavum]|uniref:PP2C family protein-serine/threonine phosphatase n=1 Tax=Nucisporomicrobium flavum TaxID=2785915 RepID=UPI003C2FC896